MKISYKGAVALAIVVFEISLWSIFLQIGGSGIGLLPELFYGFLVGSVFSVAVSLAHDRGKGLASIMRNPKLLLIMFAAGLFNDILTQLFLGIGTLGTNPSIGSIVFRSWVIMVALFTPIVLKQKVGTKQLLSTFIGFLGIYIILSGGTIISFNYTQVPFIGILLLAAACSTVSILIMNKYNTDTIGTIALFNIASLMFVAVLMFITGTNLVVAFPPEILFSILFLGIIAYGAGTMLYYYSIKILGPLVTGNSVLMVPFLTILFSFLIVGTPIKFYYIIAASLTGIGVVFQHRYSSNSKRITQKKALEQINIFDITSAFISNPGLEIKEHMVGDNRAFAIKLNNADFDWKLHADIFKKRGCMVFTNKNPHREARNEEIMFINDVLGLDEGDTALIGLGNPQNLESSLEEFVLSARSGMGTSD